MKIDFNPTVPIYLQIIDRIKRQIAAGERAPGSRVEPVRELAQAMGVNPNTGQRAFAELEREGLMMTERTAGRYITGDVRRIARLKEELAHGMIAEFVGLMQNAGFSGADILRLVKDYLDSAGPQTVGRDAAGEKQDSGPGAAGRKNSGGPNAAAEKDDGPGAAEGKNGGGPDTASEKIGGQNTAGGQNDE